MRWCASSRVLTASFLSAMKTKNVVLWCVIAFLLVLPFIIRYFRGGPHGLPSNDDAIRAEQFIALHEERVNERIESLKKQSLDESFAGLLDDQQYSSPGYHPEIKGAPVDMETLLSSRVFLKVLQQFGELPRRQAIEKLHEFCKRAIKEFDDALIACILRYEDPPSAPPESVSALGAKYMVCTTMLLAAQLGEHRVLVNQIDEMERLIDAYVDHVRKSEFFPPFVVQIAPSTGALETDCVLSVILYASKRAGIDLKAEIPLDALVLKTIPLFRWDAEATYYDFLPLRGYQKLDTNDAVEQFDVYEFPQFGSFDDQNKKSLIDTLKERLSK